MDYPLWRMMIHFLEHQTYRRGQVTVLLRQLGVQPPKVDFLDGLDVGFRAPDSSNRFGNEITFGWSNSITVIEPARI